MSSESDIKFSGRLPSAVLPKSTSSLLPPDRHRRALTGGGGSEALTSSAASRPREPRTDSSSRHMEEDLRPGAS